MRFVLLPLVATSLLLSACASPEKLPARVDQRGALKVHPGLLGQAVPPELAAQEEAGTPGAVGKGPAAGALGMKMDQTGLRTQRSVYFDLNSAAVRAEFEPVLKAHARYLAEHPRARVRVEGNADERGAATYNQQLGLKRAEAVRQALVQEGAPQGQALVKSLGESRPRLKGHDEESWAENRRADIVYDKEE